jgi:hypothetical protein
MIAHPSTPSIASKWTFPGVLLRLEGIAVFAGAIATYAYQGFGWLPFFVLLLAPDLAMLAYLVNPRVGTLVYNVVHSYVLPLALAGGGVLAGFDLGLLLALIWLAHIGMDRTVGYGLKYFTSFKDTHLSRV